MSDYERLSRINAHALCSASLVRISQGKHAPVASNASWVREMIDNRKFGLAISEKSSQGIQPWVTDFTAYPNKEDGAIVGKIVVDAARALSVNEWT